MDLPSGRWYHAIACIGKSVFLVGGYKNSSIEKFNVITRTFEKVSLLKKSRFSRPICRSSFGMCLHGTDSLLIAGGWVDDRDATTDHCFVFNTQFFTFWDVGSLETERCGHVLVNFNKEIFSIGGWKRDDYLSSIEVFDASTENWKNTELKLVTGRRHHQAAVHKQFIYVLGGECRSCILDTIEKIDVAKRKVEVLKIKLKSKRSRFSVTKIKDDLFIFGGRTEDNWGATNSTEVLNLETLEIKEGVKLQLPDRSFAACSL